MLIKAIQKKIETLYGFDSGINIEDYVKEGPTSYGSRAGLEYEMSGDALYLMIMLESDILEWARKVVQEGFELGKDMLYFSFLVEEESHLFYIFRKCIKESRGLEDISRYELELQANIDKYILCLDLMHLGGHTSPSNLKEFLFTNFTHGRELPPEWNSLYLSANALALKYCARLEERFVRRGKYKELIYEARHFSSLNEEGKARRILK